MTLDHRPDSVCRLLLEEVRYCTFESSPRSHYMLPACNLGFLVFPVARLNSFSQARNTIDSATTCHCRLSIGKVAR